jgi:hypothetical protein
LAVTKIVSPKVHCVNVAVVELLISNSGVGASSGREELLCDEAYVCYGARSADLKPTPGKPARENREQVT